jgi:uncharacterized protein YjiK
MMFCCAPLWGQYTLIPTSTIEIDVKEPSGLCIDSAQKLWVISDETQTAYHLDNSYQVSKALSLPIKDGEGIACYQNMLAVCDEKKSEVLIFRLSQNDSAAQLIKTIPFPVSTKKNKGLEGLYIRPQHSGKSTPFLSDSTKIYTVREKPPAIFIQTRHVLDSIIPNQPPKDFSGISVFENEFWILSDKEESIFRYSPSGELLQKLFIGKKKLEGIAIDTLHKRLFLVSDKSSELFIFQISK